jgi:hypothetical protein
MVLVGLLAVSAFAPTPAAGKPRATAGTYTLAVAGGFKGQGTANVTGNTVTINATVTDLKGVTGALTFSVTLKKQNHFNVTGTVIGQTATFTGRLDVPDDQKERAIKGVRITCTLKTADGRYGKIIGWVPNDKRFPNDDHPNGGNGNGDGNGNGNGNGGGNGIGGGD